MDLKWSESLIQSQRKFTESLIIFFQVEMGKAFAVVPIWICRNQNNCLTILFYRLAIIFLNKRLVCLILQIFCLITVLLRLSRHGKRKRTQEQNTNR